MPYKATRSHLSSINPIQYERNRCLNWFVARIKPVLAFATAGELADSQGTVLQLPGVSAGAVDNHGCVC